LIAPISRPPNRLTGEQEGLGTIRSNVRLVRAKMPKSGIQRRLKELAELNNCLRHLLEDSPLPRQTKTPTMSVSLHHSTGKPSEVYRAISGGYKCECDRPHLVKIRCKCAFCTNPFLQTNVAAQDWNLELVFPAPQRPSMAIAPKEEEEFDLERPDSIAWSDAGSSDTKTW
jgi:hypothetical protein